MDLWTGGLGDPRVEIVSARIGRLRRERARRGLRPLEPCRQSRKERLRWVASDGPGRRGSFHVGHASDGAVSIGLRDGSTAELASGPARVRLGRL